MTTDMTVAEQRAVRADAEQRLSELCAVRDVLLPDRDDPEVLSELTVICSQIEAARGALDEPEYADVAAIISQ